MEANGKYDQALLYYIKSYVMTGLPRAAQCIEKVYKKVTGTLDDKIGPAATAAANPTPTPNQDEPAKKILAHQTSTRWITYNSTSKNIDMLQGKEYMRLIKWLPAAHIKGCLRQSALGFSTRKEINMNRTQMRRMFSKYIRLLSIVLLLTGVVSAVVIYRSSANNTTHERGQSRRVPLTVLQSSEPVISSDHVKKTLLAPSKDGQSIYSLDSMTGELVVYDRNRKHITKVAGSFSNVEAFAVGPQGDLYIAQSDSTVQVVSSGGSWLSKFHSIFPKSIAVLGNGNVVVASPFEGKMLHLYDRRGLLLASFGELRAFDDNEKENEFLNEGRVVIGSKDQIYYVSTYAPRPYVLRFSSEGQLLGEFQIEGDAVDLQTGLTNEFLNRREFCESGGVTIITSATVSPETGHLWLGMNGLSTQGTVYEYDQTGTKVREYAFLLNSNNKRHNVTHVKDIVVTGDSLSVLTWGGTYGFKFSDVMVSDAWQVPTKTSGSAKPTWSAWANPLARLMKFWAPTPIARPGIPQPDDPPCEAQDYSCTANCPADTQPNPANCGAAMASFFPSNGTKLVTSKNCEAKPVDSTPGSATPGGCKEVVTWCDTAASNTTGSTEVTVNCTAVPTPTPTPTPTATPTPGGLGDLCGSNHPPCGDPYYCSAYGGSGGTCIECRENSDCPEEIECENGACYKTPILVDIAGNGFAMTSAANGVFFDFKGTGAPQRLSWTVGNSDDAWLVLDRNSNGTIDKGAEMFGNLTPQPTPPIGVHKNGFLALAEYDKPGNGGNGDGVIDRRDAIFSQLRLWQDTNHNGISEPSELRTLPELGVESIALDYRESRRRDQFGNVFRYRAKVYGTNHSDLGRWAYDVLLLNH